MGVSVIASFIVSLAAAAAAALVAAGASHADVYLDLDVLAEFALYAQPSANATVPLADAPVGVMDSGTLIVFGSNTTANGHPMIANAIDCAACDFRLVKVPPMHHERGKDRSVLKMARRGMFPRYSCEDRGDAYRPANGDGKSKVLGTIPQTQATHGYLDARYGLMNEYGLAIGQSPAAAILTAKSADAAKSTSLFDLAELTHIALERCVTARCAVQTMGGIAEIFGFYGDDGSGSTANGGGVLGVIDTQEAWIMHITAGLANGGAVWVAKRVPDDQVAVVANWFTIREIDPTIKGEFLFSPNLFIVADTSGLWDSSKALDFAVTFSPRLTEYGEPETMPPSAGDQYLPMKSSLRLWRVYSRLHSPLNVDPESSPHTFPFSVRPDHRFFNRTEAMALLRDHYEGTRYDLTQGILAGPFGSPFRPPLGKGLLAVPGIFPAAISLQRTSYSVLLEPRGRSSERLLAAYSEDGASRLWFAPDAPATSVFMPVYATSSNLSKALTAGEMGVMSRPSAWHAFNFVSNYMGLNFAAMSPLVYSAVRTLQSQLDESIDRFEKAIGDYCRTTSGNGSSTTKGQDDHLDPTTPPPSDAAADNGDIHAIDEAAAIDKALRHTPAGGKGEDGESVLVSMDKGGYEVGVKGPLVAGCPRDVGGVAERLEGWQRGMQEGVTHQWWNLADLITTRFFDGFDYRNMASPPDTAFDDALDPPPWWLEMVGVNLDPKPHFVQPWSGVPVSLQHDLPFLTSPTQVGSVSTAHLTFPAPETTTGHEPAEKPPAAPSPQQQPQPEEQGEGQGGEGQGWYQTADRHARVRQHIWWLALSSLAVVTSLVGGYLAGYNKGHFDAIHSVGWGVPEAQGRHPPTGDTAGVQLTVGGSQSGPVPHARPTMPERQPATHSAPSFQARLEVPGGGRVAKDFAYRAMA